MDWYLEPFRKYADFSGRARRKEFWTFFLVNILIGTVFLVLYMVALMGSNGDLNPIAFAAGCLSGLFGLAILIPSIAVAVRRLHDTGRSGFWWFIGLVPLIGGLVLIIFYLMDSDPGANDYGPSPKQPLRPAFDEFPTPSGL